jgi:hypothetical protein
MYYMLIMIHCYIYITQQQANTITWKTGNINLCMLVSRPNESKQNRFMISVDVHSNLLCTFLYIKQTTCDN